jgi:PadR family transcriptional regulator PadR
MGGQPRLTRQTIDILRVLLEADDEQYGLKISQRTKLPTGSVYPILYRLERAGWLSSVWEEADPAETGVPRRRFYQLTEDGRRQAQEAVAGIPARSTWSLSPEPRTGGAGA